MSSIYNQSLSLETLFLQSHKKMSDEWKQDFHFVLQFGCIKREDTNNGGSISQPEILGPQIFEILFEWKIENTTLRKIKCCDGIKTDKNLLVKQQLFKQLHDVLSVRKKLFLKYVFQRIISQFSKGQMLRMILEENLKALRTSFDIFSWLLYCTSLFSHQLIRTPGLQTPTRKSHQRSMITLDTPLKRVWLHISRLRRK
jgi:hypothetical protein